MGIPSYFRQIISDHPDTHFWKDDMYVDNLLIDFNSIIYNVILVLNEELGSTLSQISPLNYEEKLLTRVIKYLQHVICEVVKPKKLLYIAVDGTVPMAKMIQQRTRRYKVLKEIAFKKELERKYRVAIPTLQWNKSAISPGTSFMTKLSKLIINNIKRGNFQVHSGNLTVIFSDSSIPGEGEHKLMPTIKRIKNDEITVIYSPDADLIVLSVMSEINNIYLLREPKDSDIEIQLYSNHEFLYLSIDKCREEFIKLMITSRDYKQVLKDYTFLTFLCGNDFVTAAPFLKMKEGGIQLLIDILNEIEDGENLVNPNKASINNHKFLKLVKALAVIEEEKLQKWQKKRDRIRQGIRSTKKENSEEGKEKWELELQRFNHEEYYSPLHPHYEHLNRVFDKIDYFSSDWNNAYNKHFFPPGEDIQKVCHNYYMSLDFCLKYYHDGVPSWRWHYGYRAAPTMKDFVEYLEKHLDSVVEWELSKAFTQFEQLMYILPKQSFNLLPRVLNLGELSKYYPNNFILDIVHGTKFIYSDPILPDIPMDLIENCIKSPGVKFTQLEIERNTLRFRPYVHKRV